MSSSILDTTRLLEEEIEQNEAGIANLLQLRYDPPTGRPVKTPAISATPAPPGSGLTPIPPPYGLLSSIYYEEAVSKLLKICSKNAQRILDIYNDSDFARREEIAFLGGSTVSGRTDGESTGDVWTNFYDRIKQVKDYHRKFGNNITSVSNGPAGGSSSTTVRSVNTIMNDIRFNRGDFVITNGHFTAAERGGRRIDLLDLYNIFINIPSVKRYKENKHRQSEVVRIKRKFAFTKAKAPTTSNEEKVVKNDSLPDDNDSDDESKAKDASKQRPTDTPKIESLMEPYEEIDYISFLKTFDNFANIPKVCKYRNKQYIEYITKLLQYMESYFQKTHPLAPAKKIKDNFEKSFETQWNESQFAVWQDPPTYQDPLYAIYTDKLFHSVNLLNSHTRGKRYKKLETEIESGNPTDKSKDPVDSHVPFQFEDGMSSMDKHTALVNRSLAHDKELCRIEYMIQRYSSVLKAAIDAAVSFLQIRQSKTAKELVEEMDMNAFEDSRNLDDDQLQIVAVEEEEEDDIINDDDEKPVYNPLNLPLGWDGKPIPFWLYKLHGLGVEYKCEICGNYSYWGRRAFEKHFQEWRHAMGMRCLKIPNTTHFKEVTRIEDAICLYDRLRKQTDACVFKFDQEVECEDSDGNVMTARAYEDLRRQGLI